MTGGRCYDPSPMFVWAYLDSSGRQTGTSRLFSKRAEAEEWIGRSWQELRERGVLEVELLDREAGRSVYRMGLGPE